MAVVHSKRYIHENKYLGVGCLLQKRLGILNMNKILPLDITYMTGSGFGCPHHLNNGHYDVPHTNVPGIQIITVVFISVCHSGLRGGSGCSGFTS